MPAHRSLARLGAFLLALAAGMGLGAPPARAADAPGTAEALKAERARLRGELDKVNAQIDALKRANGVGDDYRLRARLADAESIARRLTEIDAQLGLRGGTAASGASPVPPPVAAPTDGPAELDAKADILADQVRRLRTQADLLGARARDMKARQQLRRRASDLDRDPFGPMEASKRRLASSAGVATAGGTGTHDLAGMGTQTPVTGGGSAMPPGPPSGQVAITGSTSSGGSPVNASMSPGVAGTAPGAPTPLGAGQETALSVQLRDLLDTGALADLRRLESRGPTALSPQALERAAAALRARAADLDARAHVMRSQAHPPASR